MMDGADFLTVPQDPHNVFASVEVYASDFTVTGGADVGMEPSLQNSNSLFDSKPEDLLSVKIESVELPGCDNAAAATEDESMAVEALRQLGNSYAESKSSRIQTTTPHDLPMLPCPTCDLEFRTTSDLNSHLEICRHSQYICPICNEVFDHKIDLNNHIVCHAVERPHACRICSTLFIHKQDLQQHILIHNINTVNQCQVCGQQFVRPSSLTNHMKIHNYQPGRAIGANPQLETEELSDILSGNDSHLDAPQEKIILPSISNITSLNNWNLCYEPENFNNEIKMDVGENVIVESSLNDFGIMKTEMITNEEKKPYACTKCSKSFAREMALKSHLKLHKDFLDDNFSCERCEQSFNNSHALEKHLQYCGVKLKIKKMKVKSRNVMKKNQINSKTDFANQSSFDISVYNKIYKHRCTECDKHFTTKQKLFRHMWIHRKKMYSCELCTKNFDQQMLLDSHRLSTHQSGCPYVCTECGKNFSSRQGLWEHNRIHTAEINSFKCIECEKTFTSRQGYLIHKRKHSDERPYGCRFCWKAFRDGGTLRKHERIHTGERPHACPLCSKAFNQKVVLREHVRWLHTANLTPNADGMFECTICQLQTQDTDELCAHFVKHSDQMAQLAKDASKNNIAPTADIKSVVAGIDSFPSESRLRGSTAVERNVVTQKIEQTGVAIETGEDSIECGLCGDVFDSRNHLSDHIRVHI